MKLVKGLLRDGYSPILFCRFIPTVEYVKDELRRQLRGVEVAGVTGTLPPAEREQRVAQLAKAPKRVLVCTDCLSEGINLQDGFDAVVHYDLSWNPTRRETSWKWPRSSQRLTPRRQRFRRGGFQ